MKISIGTIALFAGDFTPQYWLPCNGSVYSGTEANVLRAVRRDIVGEGKGIKLPNLANIGQVTHIICSAGEFPPDFVEEDIIGFITSLEELGVKEPPKNWVLCNGKLLDHVPMEDSRFIFTILGKRFNDPYGRVALPDLNKPGGKTYVICVGGTYPE